MAQELTESDLNELPILWEDESGKIRLIQSDERNLEIIEFRTLGLSGRGRKGTIRDSWVSIPSYHSTVSSAFRKLLDMKTKELLSDTRNDLNRLETMLERFCGHFEKTVVRK
mgnify:CR=1 FL=1